MFTICDLRLTILVESSHNMPNKNIIDNTPNIYSSDPDQRRAARWATQQKQLYKKGLLDQHQIDVLNASEGWTWHIVEYR